jgi:cytochrome c-type biogenesis protein CcmH
MTEETKVSRASWAILGVAAAALAGAVGYSQWPASSSAEPSAMAASDSSADPLAALEAATRAQPDSFAAWQALGAGLFDSSRFADAAQAFARAAELAPDNAAIWSALGEARVMANNDNPMPPAALEAFRKAAAIDAKDPRTRYFLAVKRDIDGDHQGAINDWLALLADTPAGAPWEADLRRTIEQVGKIHKIEVASRLAATRPRALTPQELPVAARAIPGPSRADMEAASQLPKGQQDAMIDGMVSGLEDKLKANPANVDGWIMLMRSRMTLGESAKAGAALKSAIAANPDAENRLRGQAKLLGVPGA